MSNTIETLPLFAGEKRSVEITLKRDAVAINLTGSTVYLIGKESLKDTDAEALIARQVITDHDDAVGGITSFLVDLTALPSSYFEGNKLLFSNIVIKDASGNVENFGDFKIEIRPSALRSTE